MAIVIKANELDPTRTDSLSRPKEHSNRRVNITISQDDLLINQPIEDAFNSFINRCHPAVTQITSIQDQPSALRKLVLESDFLSSLYQDRAARQSHSLSPGTSSLSKKSSRFEDSYSKLGRWKLKGSDELSAAEKHLLSTRHNFHLLALKTLDEENVEAFNHACWMLSQRPLDAIRIVTSELVRRISRHDDLTIDQWINSLEVLASLPARHLALFAPSVRNILLAAAQEKDEDVLSAAKKLAKILPIESVEDLISKLYILTKAGKPKSPFTLAAYAKSNFIDG